MDNNQIRKAIEYSISELEKDSALLKRGLSDIELLKENAYSLHEYQQKCEQETIDFLVSEGGLERESAHKVTMIIRGYILNGLWSRASGVSFTQAIDHASSKLAPDLKKSFDYSLRGTIMGALYNLEKKGFIDKLQGYFYYLFKKNPNGNIDERLYELTKALDVEYKSLDKQMKDELMAS
jgi:hypothetical protein